MGGPLREAAQLRGQANPPAGRGVAPVARTYFTSCGRTRPFPGDFHSANPANSTNSVAAIHRAPCMSARLDCAGGRVRNTEGQDGPRRDAERRRHHGRRRRRAGAHRGGRRRVRGHGARARSGRHQARRRRRADERSGEDQGDPGGGHDPGDGQVPHRPLRRGADPRGARGRLHRRVRGPDTCRHRAPRRQVGASPSRSSAARRTSARRCAVSRKARR